jgi:hypothetical protein
MLTRSVGRLTGIGALGVVVTLTLVTCGSPNESPASQRSSVCVYEVADCLSGLCPGCTAGSYGSCPPAASRYYELCSEDTDAQCRGRNKGRVLSSSDLYRYTRNLRIIHGVTTCAAFRAGDRGTSVELLCSDNCGS